MTKRHQWRRAPLLLASLALGGCGAEQVEQAEQARKVPVGTELKHRIDALDAGRRDALFLRAVRDAGHDCQRVIGSAYNGLHFGMPGWAARCSDGADWLVMLRADGTALVARREERPQGR